MTLRSEIETEAQRLIAKREPHPYDVIRRHKIERVREITGRPLVIYAADFLPHNPVKGEVVGGGISITLNDKDGFDEVTRNLSPDNGLDVLLYSAGGSAEATESIVELLRARFSDIRFIIPSIAKSAAAMLALSGNELLMDEMSELGPIDPQMRIVKERRSIYVPAQAIKDQFEIAQKDIQQNTSRLPAWLPILSELGPGLLSECDNHIALGRNLVSDWLAKYMFAGDKDAKKKANSIAVFLSEHNNFGSHARRVGMSKLMELGVQVLDMRSDPPLHMAIRDLHTAIMISFINTNAYKIFENSQNEHLFGLVSIQVVGPSTPQAPSPPQQVSPQEGQQIRAERRREQKEQAKQMKRGNPRR